MDSNVVRIEYALVVSSGVLSDTDAALEPKKFWLLNGGFGYRRWYGMNIVPVDLKRFASIRDAEAYALGARDDGRQCMPYQYYEVMPVTFYGQMVENGYLIEEAS